MIEHQPPAVYKCIIPVKKPLTTPSAIYHSLFRQLRGGARPYPAWPHIDDPHQPHCHPALLRALYYEHRSTSVSTENVVMRAEAYLSRQESIEAEIKELTLAFIQDQQAFWQHFSKSTRQPQILFGLPPIRINSEDSEEKALLAYETAMQALIYGNFNEDSLSSNFYGVNEAYACAHEWGHRSARMSRSGVIQDVMSASTVLILVTLAEAILPAEDLEGFVVNGRRARDVSDLWVMFNYFNKEIYRLAKKFEPVEEIFANYMAMRFLPIELKHKIEPLIKKELAKRKWDKADKSFSEACDGSNSPHETALQIFDLVGRILEQKDFDSLELLYIFSEIRKRRNYDRLDLASMLEQLGLLDNPSSLYEDMLHISSFSEETQKYLSDIQLNLIGRFGDNDIEPLIIFHSEGYNDYAEIRIFYESMRQQLSQHCGLVCPLTSLKQCCGRKESLQMLCERLPDKDKKHIKYLNCDLFR